MPADLTRKIAARIAEAQEHYPDRVSADGGALLLYSDMGGQCFLRPNGEIVTLPSDSATPVDLAVDSKWRTAAVVAGSQLYPELRALLPDRPKNSRDCRACSGGWVQVGDMRMICGVCNGLGWQPEA